MAVNANADRLREINEIPELDPTKPLDAADVSHHNRALKNLPRPKDIPSIYATQEREQQQRPAVRRYEHPASAARSIRAENYATKLEDAYYANRGVLPPTFLAQLDPEDLDLFADEDFAAHVSPELHPTLTALSAARRNTERQQELAELYYQEAQEVHELANRLSPMAEARVPGLDISETGPTGELVAGQEFRMEDWEKAARELAGGGRDPQDVALEQDAMAFVGTAFKGVANGIGLLGGAAMTGLLMLVPPGILDEETVYRPWYEGLAQFMGPEQSERHLGYVVNDTPEIVEARQLLNRMRSGEGQAHLKDQVLTDTLPGMMWDDMVMNDPETVQEYVDVYGMEMAQMGFFIEFQDLRDDPTVEEQTEDLLEGIDSEFEAAIQGAEESNFMLSGEIMRGLASWGAFVDNINANLLVHTLSLTDQDQRQLLAEARVDEYMAEMAQLTEDGGHRPSGVLGIDGTFGGLMVDFTMGFLDPTNIFFSPGLRFGRMAVASRGAIRSVMKSPAMRMGLRDVAYTMSSRHRSGLGKAATVNGYAEVGLAGPMLEAVGYLDDTLPAHPWVQSPLGAHAFEVDVNLIDSLLDDVQREAAENLNVKTVAEIEASLANKGFEEPLVLEFDPATGQLALAQGGGLKRLRAVENLNRRGRRPDETPQGRIDRVPVTVREIKQEMGFPWANHPNLHPDFLPHLTKDSDRLVQAGLERWQEGGGRQSALRQAIDDEIAGKPLPDSVTGDFHANKVEIIETRNQARAIIRQIQESRPFQDQPTTFGGPNKLEPDERLGLWRGTDALGHLEDGFFAPPRVGEAITLKVESATSSLKNAKRFAGFERTGERGWIIRFPDDTPALRNTTNLKVEHEFLVSGNFEIVAVDEATRVVTVRRAGDVLPRVEDAVIPRTGVPVGRSVEGLGGKVPTELNVSESGHFRPTQLFDEKTLGVKADLNRLAQVTEEALKRGGDIPFARKSWGAVGLGHMFHRLADSTVGEALTPYIQSIFDLDNVPMGGAVGTSTLMEMTQFFGSNSPEWTNAWMRRTLQNEQALGKANREIQIGTTELTRLYKLDQELATRQADLSPHDVAVKANIAEEYLAGVKNVDEARRIVRQLIREKEGYVRAKARATHGAVDWQAHVDEMMDDYNRQFIATNPAWQGVDPLTGRPYIDPETGLVDWAHIRRYRGPDTDELLDASPTGRSVRSEKLEAERQLRAKQFEIELENGVTANTAGVLAEFERAGHSANGVVLPATPIELAAAAQMGGAQYTKWSQEAWFASIRNSGYLIDQLWKANVLLTPRTFAVMSIDELTSLMHNGGIDFVSRYLQARAAKMRAGLGNFEKSGKIGGLGPKTAERVRALRDIPDEYQMYDLVMAEHASRELITMKKGDLGYPQAARQYTQRNVQNPALRAYFRGPEEFQAWTQTRPGQEFLLNYTVQYLDEAGEVARRPLNGWEEAHQLVGRVWEYIESVAKKEGVGDKLGDFRAAFEETAARIDGDQSGRVYSLPDWVHKYTGPIPGYRPAYPGSSMGWHAIARGYEMGAGNPAAFRKGLAADMMRTAEKTRLRALFEDQGHRVVSDAELMEILRRRGIDVTEINVFDSPWLHAELFDQGIVSEGYIAQIAEKRAYDYITESTYSFEQGSRAGRQAKAIFPFGPAWGEMYARWGRALGSRAIARPWLRKLGLQKSVQKIADGLPFDPRTAGFLSRVANLELDGIDVIPGEGESDLDFSSVTFLPTSGEAGLSVLIPSLGPLPMTGLDEILRHLTDPANDPQGFQRIIDNVSQILPGARFTGRGDNFLTQGVMRFFGSGNVGLMTSLATEFGKGVLHNPNRDLWRYTGDIRSELNRVRAVSAVFSDPEIMQELLALDDPESVNMAILGSLYEADRQAAIQSGWSSLQSWLVPVRGALDTNLDEVYQSWVRSARNYDDLFNLDDPGDEVLANNGQALQRLGDNIRRQFFALPQWQRDVIVATNPELAFNLVQSYEWSSTAPDYLPGRDIPYRTVGSSPTDQSLSAALDRHAVYVQRGWAVPRDSRTRPHEAIGMALSARDDVTRFIYESSAERLNDLRWEEAVTEDTKLRLQFMLDETPHLGRLGVNTPRELWELWGGQRDRVLDSLYDAFGVDPGPIEEADSIEAALKTLTTMPEAGVIGQEDVVIELLDRIEAIGEPDEETVQLIDTIKDLVRMPEAEEAWSPLWNGDSVENFSSRMRGFPVFMSEEATYAAEALGINVEDGMLGEDFVETLQEYRFREVKGAAWNAVRLHYTDYLNERGAAFTAGMSSLSEVRNDPALASSYRERVGEFMDWIDLAAQDTEGPITRRFQDEAVDRFMRIKETGPTYIDWDKVWHQAFRPRFGPLEWEPPVPPEPLQEDGTPNPNAWVPHIQGVVDGDTIAVSANRGPSLVGGITLPGLGIEPRAEFGTGAAGGHLVRLLGINSPEYSIDFDSAEQAKQQLEDALMEARENGDRIYLVRDPDFTGSNTDPFGRELAWLWIGDNPYYFPDEYRRTE